MEASVAILVLAGLAFFGPGRHAGSAAVATAGVSRWTHAALPVLSDLINDSSAIEKDSGAPPTVAAGAGQIDTARYERDLVAARRLPAPPDTGLAQAWRSTLAELTTAKLDLESVGSDNPAALTRTHVRFVAIETVLRQFQQAIRPAD